jgi:hypothetical protein
MQSQRRRLQDRVDQEPVLGKKFAAAVRRSSGYTTTTLSHNTAVVSDQSQPPKSSTATHENKDPVEVVGDVVERRRTKVSRRQHAPRDNIPNLSDNVNSKSIPVNGFPSVQQRHIGTFLLSKNLLDASPQKSSDILSNIMPEIPTSVDASLSILEQSSKDAQSLLEQMSLEEIRESIQELHSVLKPDTIRFLRQRGSLQKVKSSEEPLRDHLPSPSEPLVDSTVNRADSSPEVDPTELNSTICNTTIDNHLKEKMATVISSIQTYKDLDDAYDSFVTSKTTGETDEPILYSIKDEYTDDEKFQLACKLLRSSSPQQTIWAARVVSNRLKYEFERNPCVYSLAPPIYSECEINHQKATTWPFPVLLPVSLRCLLDSQSNQSLCGNGGLLLTTSVLQSLFLLVQLRACSDHAFYNPSEQKRDFYQVDHLDDVVPAAPLRFCYFAAVAEPVNSPTRGSTLPNGAPTLTSTDGVPLSTGAYWTSSSTATLAIADGQAFLRDPMWTLLSRMRIIPRLAEILQMFKSGAALPIEARTSICGILAMIGQRSPGAASAIIHHPTLIDDLVERMIVHQNNSARYDSKSVIPFLSLLCTLARQSRVVAEGIHRRISSENSPVMLHLLATYPKTKDNAASCDRAEDLADFTLQQWTLILWRTLLRYGLGFNLLPTILTLSVDYLTLGVIHAVESVSLAPEMYSCFAVILNVTSMNIKMLRTFESESVNTDSIYKIVALPWRRQAIHHLQALVGNDSFLGKKEVIRLTTGIFRFWGALLGSVANMISAHGAVDDIIDILVSDLKLLIPVLFSTVCSVRMASMVSLALSCTHYPTFHIDSHTGLTFLNAATRAASFLESFVCLVSQLKDFIVLTSDVLLTEVSGLENKLAGHLLCEIGKHSANNVNLERGDEHSIETMQRNCLNRVQAKIVSFLCNGDFGYEFSELRTMAFAVIGRLSVGEEFTASLLFRIPELFRPSTSAASSKNVESSLISKVLFRELIRTESYQLQFDHSSNLDVDWNLFKNSKYPVAVQSLLSDASPVTKPENNDSVYFLPLGKYWLWKLLSGSSINPELSTEDLESDETIQVLETALKIIDELENDLPFYCVNLNKGPKLYYLVNFFLSGKLLLSQNRVVSQVEKLFNHYFYGIEPHDFIQFAEECRMHSRMTHVGFEGKTSASNEMDIEAILNPQESDSYGFSTKHLSSLETFVGDLCDTYLDFGFHFSPFTKCVRLFLVHGFPTKVRCSIIHRLRGDLHLLTLHDENEPLATLLTRFVAGGLPSLDQSSRDDPIFIDCVASIYVKGSICRPDDVFIKSMAMCILVRSLAISVVTRKPSSLLVSKRRILSLESAMATQVVLAAAVWLSKGGSVSSLVSSVLLNDSQQKSELPDEFSIINIEGTDWDDVVHMLESVSRINVPVLDC